jgi:5-carboxymethyl-2-hydroxymuconate isomerase
MPHIIIEHDHQTKNEVDLKAFAQNMHDVLALQETVKLEAIKTRTIEIQNLIIADNSIERIVHITVLLLKGRSDELKQKMAEALFDKAKVFFQEQSISVTVNVTELGAYCK